MHDHDEGGWPFPGHVAIPGIAHREAEVLIEAVKFFVRTNNQWHYAPPVESRTCMDRLYEHGLLAKHVAQRDEDHWVDTYAPTQTGLTRLRVHCFGDARHDIEELLWKL